MHDAERRLLEALRECSALQGADFKVRRLRRQGVRVRFAVVGSGVDLFDGVDVDGQRGDLGVGDLLIAFRLAKVQGRDDVADRKLASGRSARSARRDCRGWRARSGRRDCRWRRRRRGCHGCHGRRGRGDRGGRGRLGGGCWSGLSGGGSAADLVDEVSRDARLCLRLSRASEGTNQV
ncbi:hypothetical protein M885DRAFT_516575 [Pelagophyceae sp. CCMP2097]|nr:hypothetical protein M885DRAFT_516575 [Pelagophyceae sp. CCMP2097]